MNNPTFSEGDIVEVHGIDGKVIGRAVVMRVIQDLFLKIEFEDLPQNSLGRRRIDIVQTKRCKKV